VGARVSDGDASGTHHLPHPALLTMWPIVVTVASQLAVPSGVIGILSEVLHQPAGPYLPPQEGYAQRNQISRRMEARYLFWCVRKAESFRLRSQIRLTFSCWDKVTLPRRWVPQPYPNLFKHQPPRLDLHTRPTSQMCPWGEYGLRSAGVR
jgi:hypothetical protein